ncbi:MAG: uracil-DNA glycosylase [Longimicrobiales bacterium]|nr:uracil-DNA glycosylase [Longimicrobiales bacterium]
MTERPSIKESARLLRQRIEMGGADLVLDGMTREEALALAAAAATLESERPSAGAADVLLSSAGRGPTAPRPSSGGTGGQAEPDRFVGKATAPRPASVEGQTSSSTGTPLPVLPDDYEELRGIALGCTACRLSAGRTQVVFSDGPPTARLMVVGEAPGANEDKTGVPFVGAAGQFLDLLLATVGLDRKESVYIANVLKCRPPGNRDPMTDEIETCSPLLRKQIDLVKPSALLAVGSFSGKLLTGQDKSALGKLRGNVHSYHGVPLVVTYHPAALLRNSNWTRAFWDDMQLLRGVIDNSQGA